MSLSDFTNTGRADVIPGYILSKPRLIEIGMAEDEFARRYIEAMGKAVANLPAKLAADVLAATAEDIRRAAFAWGGATFDLWAQAKSSLPFLTLMCLRVKHPQEGLEKVAELLAAGDTDRIAAAVWALWGYVDQVGNAVGGGASVAPPPPPTGPSSTPEPSSPPAKADSDSPPSNSEIST